MFLLVLSVFIVVVSVLIFIYVLMNTHDIVDDEKKLHKQGVAKHEKSQKNVFEENTQNADIIKNGLKDLQYSNVLMNEFKDAIHEHVVGMDELVNGLLVTLLAGGHVLVEGVPGLAKTKTVHTFADLLGLGFVRVQFTPDMLPSDLLGVELYNNKLKEFEVKLGPVVNNVVLADEINRSTPKLQSALLEAMQEQQVSLGGKTHKLPQPFMVLATQNPIEQDGTYPLPEAQIDRFLCKIIVDYPSAQEEHTILSLLEQEEKIKKKDVLFTASSLLELIRTVQKVYLSDQIKSYITALVAATRNEEYSYYIRYGASPRGSIALMNTAKALAFLQGRDFVIVEDVQRMILPTLRHRLLLSYDAKVDAIDVDTLLVQIASSISSPSL